MFDFFDRLSLLQIPNRPVILEPVDKQLLTKSNNYCKRASIVSTILLVFGVLSIPFVLFFTCQFTNLPRGNLEKFIVLNGIFFCILSPFGIIAGQERKKHFYLPMLVYLVKKSNLNYFQISLFR